MKLERLTPPGTTEKLAQPAEAALSLMRRRRLLIKRQWPGFGEPFNGQAQRHRTVDFLIGDFAPDALVETGTFLGFTTRTLAAYGLPTYTVEVSTKYRVAARHALRDLDDRVTLFWGDSAEAIRTLANRRPFERPLAYLDAHWETRVPLDEELEALFGEWPDAIAVIDDFQVPDQPGYGYDIYGGVPLALSELNLPAGTTVAFPAGPPTEETGARRGTAYLGRGAGADSLAAAAKASLVSLRPER